MSRVVRAMPEHLGGAQVRYHYPCGHYRTKTLTVPAPGGGRQPMSSVGVRITLRGWRNSRVNVPPCPTCKARALAEEEE